MSKLGQEYRKFFADKALVKSAVMAILFLVASVFINYYAGTFATESASNPVTDIILSNTRVYDLDGLFVYGFFFLFFFITTLCLTRPARLPFIVKSIALFVVIRSVFITLTHIGPFATRAVIDPTSFINDFSFGADLFFSGHTGLPFLLALIYWDSKYLRIFFVLLSIFFGIVVLLAHLHYSIDVLSAFFITYTIFHITQKLFKKDQAVFLADLA